MPKDDDVCLHCGERRETIRRKGYICATLTGYESPEIDEEWPRHRFESWSNRELDRWGIPEEDRALHRRTSIVDLERWVAPTYECLRTGHPGEIMPGICGSCYGRIIGPASSQEMLDRALEEFIAQERAELQSLSTLSDTETSR